MHRTSGSALHRLIEREVEGLDHGQRGHGGVPIWILDSGFWIGQRTTATPSRSRATSIQNPKSKIQIH
jgi:hypothetical protein